MLQRRLSIAPQKAKNKGAHSLHFCAGVAVALSSAGDVLPPTSSQGCGCGFQSSTQWGQQVTDWRKSTRAGTVMAVMDSAWGGPWWTWRTDPHPEGPGHLPTHAERTASNPLEAISPCAPQWCRQACHFQNIPTKKHFWFVVNFGI